MSERKEEREVEGGGGESEGGKYGEKERKREKHFACSTARQDGVGWGKYINIINDEKVILIHS